MYECVYVYKCVYVYINVCVCEFVLVYVYIWVCVCVILLGSIEGRFWLSYQNFSQPSSTFYKKIVSKFEALKKKTSGLYYKHMTIVSEDSSFVIKWSSKLIDAARGVIYDRHMFIAQATVQ